MTLSLVREAAEAEFAGAAAPPVDELMGDALVAMRRLTHALTRAELEALDRGEEPAYRPSFSSGCRALTTMLEMHMRWGS